MNILTNQIINIQLLNLNETKFSKAKNLNKKYKENL